MQIGLLLVSICFFFFNDTATTEIYTLSLHDALPICHREQDQPGPQHVHQPERNDRDRKSTRLNSSHLGISYAVFCLKKKNKQTRRKSRENTNKHTQKPETCTTQV